MTEGKVRPPDRILNDIVGKKGKGAAAQRKFAASKESNWLLALTQHSFTKLADNEQLSDLERSIAPLQDLAVPNQQGGQGGQVAAGPGRDGRNPGGQTSRPPATVCVQHCARTAS